MPRALLFTLDALVLTTLAVVLGVCRPARSPGCAGNRRVRQLGQYRLGRLLEVPGGWGAGPPGRTPTLKRPCALKLIRLGEQTDLREALGHRSTSEVRLTATLSHPNIVDIYDYGLTDDGTFYYVMEHLLGLILAGLVEPPRPVAAGAGRLPAAATMPAPQAWPTRRG